GVPLYACDPSLLDLGTKSGSRQVFREAGVPMPPGHENLRDEVDVADALVDLWEHDPDLGKAVGKLNEGVSGAGNAIFGYDWVRDCLGGEQSRYQRNDVVRVGLPGLEC